MTIDQLTRDVRLLKTYAVTMTALVVVLLLGGIGLAQNQRTKFVEIDVERINVVDANGKVAFVLANPQRMPGPSIGGKELPRELSQGRTGSAGMLFVDAQGNEVGGLLYGARVRPDGTYSASASLTFDQHNQDQVVGVQYADTAEGRAYGLSVWDRPTKISLQDLAGLMTTIPDRQTREARFRELAQERGETVTGARRVFVGSQDRTASVRVMDTTGRDRVRVLVDATNNPRIEFLDENGAVTYSLPPR